MSQELRKNHSSIFQSPEVRVVEASAGSGKTFALAKRYVQLLLSSPVSLEPAHSMALRTILAITFTNKAAVEMKARILEFLKKIALNSLSATEYQEIIEPLGLVPSESSARAFVVMESLIRNYNFFQVQTIDSFINALLSGCSFKIQLSANFKIKRNSRDYLAVSLDRLIDRAVADKDIRQAFHHFLHQYLFIENRSGWFPKKDLLKLMVVLFGRGNSFAGDFLSMPMAGEDLFIKKKTILKLMNELRDLLPENTHAGFSKKFLEFLKEYLDSFDVDSISDYFEREEFPATKGKPINQDVERCWHRIRRELQHLCEMEAASLFNPYIEVFQLTVQELRKLTLKDDVLFLEELNKKARSLFDDNLVTVEELYYRLATRFHHYMVDEFQDTSRLQWENLSMMVEEALSTGGSLFYVGDKKQAIYSFRGGDSSLFDEVKNHFAAYVREELLENNYRSRRNIVEFNNRIFSIENLERFISTKEERDLEKNKKNAVCLNADDRQALHRVFANAHQNARPGFDGGFVSVVTIEGDKKEEREEISRQKIVALIKDLRGRFALGDIAILTRNNSEVETMTGWLLHEGIAVESERTTDVKANKTIEEIVALLNFLDSPIDNVNFSNFILGDTFARASNKDSKEFHDFIFKLRPRITSDASFYIYKEFRDVYPELWENFFEDFFKNVGLYPLYEFTVNLIERLGICKNFPDAQGFVMHFLEVIKKREKEYGDLRTFLEYFEDPLPEDLFVRVIEHDAIRILTVHKSKGLEFPVVILPALEMEIKAGSGGKDGQQSFIMHHDEDGTHLLRLKDKYRHFSPQLNKFYEYEYKRSFLSELNTVYVALTRSVDEMHIFIHPKAGNSLNVAQFLIPEDCYAVGRPMERHRKGKEMPEAKQLQLSPTFAHDWMGFLRDEFSDSSLNRRATRRQGEVVHEVLSFVKNLDQLPLDECLRQAEASVGSIFADFAVLSKDIQALVASPLLRPFFYTADDVVLNELEFVDAAGETKRIDRLVVRPDHVDVIDFKSSREDHDSHKQQVQNYLTLVAQAYPSKKVQGWLVYLNDRSLEAVA